MRSLKLVGLEINVLERIGNRSRIRVILVTWYRESLDGLNRGFRGLRRRVIDLSAEVSATRKILLVENLVLANSGWAYSIIGLHRDL